MTELGSFLLLSIAVFLGAFVSGFAGFAFSAVAGAILLHVLQPLEAIPLMMACSIGVQGASLWALRETIRWRESLVLTAGGTLGVPFALWLLHHADTRSLQQIFGLTVASYSSYMLFKPCFGYLQEMKRHGTALIGFGGGLIGGFTAMPGALPTIWYDLHGVPKMHQRGLVQPFIAGMQIIALAIMAARHDFSSKVLIDLALCLPALAAGTALGMLAFQHIDEALFRRLILCLLLASGLVLML
jgi:uncharacterized membrane protein YfcA